MSPRKKLNWNNPLSISAGAGGIWALKGPGLDASGPENLRVKKTITLIVYLAEIQSKSARFKVCCGSKKGNNHSITWLNFQVKLGLHRPQSTITI